MPNEVLTPEQRAEWKRLCEKATPEPWNYRPQPGADMHMIANGTVVVAGIPNLSAIFDDSDEDARAEQSNGEFIAAASTALPLLLDEVERLERERDALREMPMRFMVEGGPVVMASDFDAMKARAESAEAALRAQQQWKPTHETNNRLLEFATRFKLDGDWMKCRKCKRAVVASRIDEPLSHKSGCALAEHEYPWREFLALLLPPAPAETEKE